MNRTHTSSLALALERVGDRWSLLIVDALLRGPKRWTELSEEIAGIAPNILSGRLKDLEKKRLVRARPYTQRPVRMAYELTAPGRELAGALRLLAQWGAEASPDADAVRHDACGTPLEVHWYCPTCDRRVGDRAEGDERYL